jgi:nicotinate dehydrogenase subunit A
LPYNTAFASPVVHKASNALQRGIARLARLYTNGIFRERPAQNFATQRGLEGSMTQTTMRLTVNGKAYDVGAAPDTALLYVLRNDLELNGPKYGCGLGECGACAVLIDGVAARSCVIPIEGCTGRDIVTLEGLGTREHPDPVQQAFISEQAAQCGYCLNGMIITTKALLLRSPRPSEDEVLEALRHHLCRCGAHIEIMRAAMRAAGSAVEAQS